MRREFKSAAARRESEGIMNARLEALDRRRAAAKHKTFPDRESFIPYPGRASRDDMRVLHIVPFIYYEKGYEFLGSTKDIDGRRQYLWQCGAPFDTFSHLKNQFRLADELSFFDLPSYTHIIVDLSVRVEDLAYLRKRWPAAKLVVRSHNPEVTHRLDHIRAAQRFALPFAERKPVLANLAVFFRRERGVAKFADAVLHIETRNTAWYWRALGFRGEVLTTPYFTSDCYLKAIPKGRLRKKQIVCVSSSHPGLLTADMLANFHRAAYRLEGRRPDWAFFATGDPPATIGRQDISPRVRHLGFVADILSLLTDSFAVAVTSDLGRGFKTKILEAIMCGAWVIVPPGLMRRMPEVLKSYCAVIDPKRPGDSLDRAIEELSGREWPKGDPNTALREEAYQALDAAIFGRPETKRAFAPLPACKTLSTRSAP